MYQGSIVEVDLPTRDGFSKPRPAIVISETKENQETGMFACVLLSASSYHTNPRPKYFIVVPSHPDRLTSTKLPEPTVAMCDHLFSEVPIDSVIRKGGYAKAKIVERVLDAVKEYHDPDSSEADEE